MKLEPALWSAVVVSVFAIVAAIAVAVAAVVAIASVVFELP